MPHGTLGFIWSNNYNTTKGPHLLGEGFDSFCEDAIIVGYKNKSVGCHGRKLTYCDICGMKRIINTSNAPAAIGPYSQAVEAGGTLYLSGQIAIDPKSGELVNASIEAETIQVMKNMSAVLEEAGYSLEDVVKCSIFMSSMDHYATVNDVYARYFTAQPPAREAVAVKTLPKNVNVEISAIAVS